MTKNPTPPVPLREVVARNLREIMRELDDFTMTDLANTLGKSRPWLYRRTNGSGPITTDDIDALAEALGVSTDRLTRREE